MANNGHGSKVSGSGFGSGSGGGGAAASHSDAHGAGEHHIIPLSVYLRVIAILFVLTGITVLVAQFDFGEWNTVIAFAIASVKALLVLAFFMHLKYDDMMNRVIIASGAFFLLILFLFCFLDQATRVLQRSTL